MADIGDKLRSARKAKGMSIEDILQQLKIMILINCQEIFMLEPLLDNSPMWLVLMVKNY